MENKQSTTYRGSTGLFVARLIAVLLVTDIAYSVVSTFLLGLIANGIQLPFDLHHHTAILLMLFSFGKIVFQTWAIIRIAISWTTTSFSITQTHLVTHKGVLTSQQTMYDLHLIRSVVIHQSLLEKLLRCGTICIEFSASGGYTDAVTLPGISNPKHIEHLLRHQ